nr:EAL domain-containing protein [Roseibium litorale]
MRLVVDQVSDYLFIKDRDCRFVFANRSVAEDLGIKNAVDLLGRSDADIHSPQLARKYEADEREVMRSGEPKIDFEEFIIRPDGTRKWVSSSKFPLRGENGVVYGIFGISRDITARKRTELLMTGQARILEMIATGRPLPEVLEALLCMIEEQLDGVLGSILLLDESGKRLLHGAAPSLPKAYCDHIHGVEIGQAVGSCGTAAFTGQPVIVDDIMTNPLWAPYTALAEPFGLTSCWSTPIISHDKKVLGTFAMYRQGGPIADVAESKLIADTVRLAAIAIERTRAEERIRFLAENDTLTGLPNRRELEHQLEQLLVDAEKNKTGVAVVFCDIDRFKSVNDSFGHAIGDLVLQIVSERIREVLPDDHILIRFGGDEFVLVISGGLAEKTNLQELLGRVRAAVAAPMHLAGQTFRITCSMGTSVYPEDGATAEVLLQHADTAMYQSKKSGRDTFQFYDRMMSEGSLMDLTLLEDMRVGLESNQFFLEYQPQFDLQSGQLIGLEALARWNHPKKGRVPPSRFIPLAEESGLIGALGDWVLEEACRQVQRWNEKGYDPILMAVNVSQRQFSDVNLVKKVKETLQVHGVKPSAFEFEITESLLAESPQMAVAKLSELRAMGMKLAIDDFGTGYSSLSALRSFPLTRLKIDRTFIENAASDPGSQGIVRSIILLGRELGLNVIAEGVETNAQKEFLLRSGCVCGQGYLFGAPMGADEIVKLLARSPPAQLRGIAS